MNYAPQVDKTHYEGRAYRSLERWSSYWHQLAFVRANAPKTVLEVGVGEGVVATTLRGSGVTVTTVDVAADLNPDVIASITKLPFGDHSFDTVLAAEVLEHISFEDVPTALRELARVGKWVVISLPHPGYVFSFVCKLPMLPTIEIFFQIPFLWQHHTFNGEHYWELGKRGYSVRRFITVARDAGLHLDRYARYADDPGHRYFIFSS